jgi:hypothetical protein
VLSQAAVDASARSATLLSEEKLQHNEKEQKEGGQGGDEAQSLEDESDGEPNQEHGGRRHQERLGQR